MGDIFLKLLNTSITASWLIMVVLCIRLLFHKIPKGIICILWGIVAIRLICPFSIECKFSLQPGAEPIKSSTIVEGEIQPYIPSIDSNMTVLEEFVNPILAESFAYPESDSAAPLQIVTGIAGYIWLCGMISLSIFAIVSIIRLHLLVREAVRYKKNVYICDNVRSPFILGIVKPRIFISSALNDREISYVIAHEKAHLRRKDHVWKPVAYLLLCIYWFNPLCWLSYNLLCKDIELACDEKVIRNMRFIDIKEYSRVLISCAAQRHLVMVCPVAFGEVGVRERVKKILKYKKPSFLISVAAILICIVVAVCFLTDPVSVNFTERIETEATTEMQKLDESENLQQTEKDSLEQSEVTDAVSDLAYYLELSASDLEFQNMSAERKDKILSEYGTLVDGCTLISRESMDGTTEYIVGCYDGEVTQSPLYDMQVMEYSGSGMTEMVQVLYLEENYEALDRILFSEGISSVSTEGYVIQESKIFLSRNKDCFLIQPVDSSLLLSNTFYFYNIPERGRSYVEDALTRGIALNEVAEPYLSVSLLSEKYGEITENIPLTEEEASAMLVESKMEIPEGCGFIATLNINGESELFSERTGVPQSAYNLAVEKCGYKLASSQDITSFIEKASLISIWQEEPVILEDVYLTRLEEILKSAEYSGVGNCGYKAKLVLELENGETMTVFKGMDDCGSLVFGSYGGYKISKEADTEFWEMFGLGANAEERLNRE